MSHHIRETIMRKIWLGVAVAAALGVATSAKADTMHGYCVGCVDNGTNTPTSTNPLTNFGFLVDPGPQTGTYLIDILVPNNVTGGPFTITGTQGGTTNTSPIAATATLFSATPWTSGQLDAYLGFAASPTNPIGAYLPSTQALDPGATGFFVFQANLGNTQLTSNTTGGPLLNIAQSFNPGTYVVAFLQPEGIATPNSAAIFETGPRAAPGPVAGAGIPGLISAFGAVMLALNRRRKRRNGLLPA